MQLENEDKAQILPFRPKNASHNHPTAWHETKMGQYSVTSLTALLRQINGLLAQQAKNRHKKHLKSHRK